MWLWFYKVYVIVTQVITCRGLRVLSNSKLKHPFLYFVLKYILYRIISTVHLWNQKWHRGLEQVLSFPVVVSDWKSDQFLSSYGHLCEKCRLFTKIAPSLRQMDQFSIRNHHWKAKNLCFRAIKIGVCALIRACAFIGDNTVFFYNIKLSSSPYHYFMFSQVK